MVIVKITNISQRRIRFIIGRNLLRIQAGETIELDTTNKFHSDILKIIESRYKAHQITIEE